MTQRSGVRIFVKGPSCEEAFAGSGIKADKYSNSGKQILEQETDETKAGMENPDHSMVDSIDVGVTTML